MFSDPECSSWVPCSDQGVLSNPMRCGTKWRQYNVEECAPRSRGLHNAGGAAQASSQAVATDVQKAVATALAKEQEDRLGGEMR